MLQTFKVKILGCTAATPTSTYHTTVQWVQLHSHHLLLDCAEGAQMQIRKMKLPLMKINNIFISHLHGDHYLGLPGLLFTYHLLGREKALNIYAPPGLEEIINPHFTIANVKTRFKTNYHIIKEHGQKLFENKALEVEAIEMKHSIPCFGFLIKEKQKERNIKKESVKKYKIGIEKMHLLKNGEDLILDDGTVIPNSKITKESPKPRSYAFCSDTLYTESFLDKIRGVDLLYHEATFLQDMTNIAHEKTHATAIEAAKLAKKAGAGKLILGHYSARYDDTDGFLKEARPVFPNTIVAEEGMTIEL